jgi:hypothetical protein
MADKEKVSFMLHGDVKERLEDLKSTLRRRGLARSVATESAIVEALIELANENTLYQALRNR